MEKIFVILLNRSISASVLILFVLLFRIVLKKAPRRLQCLLWAIVAVRLICPVNFSSPFSAYGVMSSSVSERGEVEYIHFVGERVRPMAVLNRHENEILQTDGNSDVPAEHQPDIYLPSVVLIWEVGVAVLFCYAVFSAIKLKLCLRDAVCCKENIWISDFVRTPFIMGVLRPRIYLNSDIRGEQMDYIVAHEQAHIKRLDYLWKPLGYSLLCVYWFQPMCWLAYLLFCRDMELACDESVIRDKDMEWKKDYSTVLLECSMQKMQTIVYPLAFGEVGVKERVKAVITYQKPAFWMVSLTIAAGIVIAVCFLTSPYKTYRIDVIFPVNGTDSVYYSDEEVCPRGTTLTVYAGEGMGDGAIRLKPVSVTEKNYEEAYYITPGMPVKIDVESGVWYQIGLVNPHLTAGEERKVFLSVKNVVVRIASTEVREAEVIGDRNPADKAISAGGNPAEDALTDDGSRVDGLRVQDMDNSLVEESEAFPDKIFPLELIFASGAGAWGTKIILWKDGFFQGRFDDTDAHDHYFCEFEGRFGQMENLDEESIAMTLEELNIIQSEKREWTEGDVHYIASDPYGVEKGRNYILYSPETPVDGLDEEFLSWWPNWMFSSTSELNPPKTLSCYGLYNVETGYGFFDYSPMLIREEIKE